MIAKLAAAASHGERAAIRALAKALAEAILARRSRPRARATPRKSAAALLRTHAPALPRRVKEAVIAAAIDIVGDRAETTRALSPNDLLPQREAAQLVGLTVAELLRLCVSVEGRRRLGWPRPLGNRIHFHRGALDPRFAAEFFASLPPKEPWPRETLPAEWEVE